MNVWEFLNEHTVLLWVVMITVCINLLGRMQ